MPGTDPPPLDPLADHLAARQGAILDAWREAVTADAQQPTARTLTRPQFEDHIPDVLDAFVARLRAGGAGPAARAAERGREAEHGLHRWQQGYRLQEVVREWGHLQLVLLDEIDGCTAARPEAAAVARRELAALCRDGVCRSAAKFHELKQAEAAGHVDDLRAALADLRRLEARRAETLREAAHDLRGSLGVATTAVAVLNLPTLPDDTRAATTKTLRRGLASLRDMLNDLMDLARLEAGHERPAVAPFDAAALLRDLCDTARPAATDRGLHLTADGPTELPVDGDPVKVQRVAQNLVLNAVKYTRVGGVAVRWEPPGGDGRWALVVADTGPGLSHAVPMVDALEQATAAARSTEPTAPRPAQTPSESPRPGEGIGLSIVKRLCDLLDATIELDNSPGVGCTFRVKFPCRYPG